MKKSLLLLILIGGMGAAVSAQTESDFQTSENRDETLTITMYTGWDTDIKIPSSIGGKTVTAIGFQAFMNCDLTSALIPDTVISIQYEAFTGNKLTSVIIPDSVKTIDKQAFGIFTYYSYMCNGQKTGTYPVDKNWEEKPEKEAESFLYAETPYGLAITGYKGDSKRLSIPDKLDNKPVKHIASLKGKDLTGVRMPDSVTSIGYGAFFDNKLSTVIIGNSVIIDDDGDSSFNYEDYRKFNPYKLNDFEGFSDVYDSNGKKAGTYTYNVRTHTWTYKAK